MRSRLAARLGRWMPAGLRTEIFEPAVHDLDAEYVRQIRPASRVVEALLKLRHRFHVLGVFLECWRLAVIETFARRPHPPVLIDRPAAREPFTMLYYVLRHAVRVLARDPGFTGAAVLALALGIGANVAVFAVLEAVVLRPLPYPDADGLVILRHQDMRTGITKRFIAIGDFIDIAARQTVLEDLNRFASSEGTIHEQGEPIRVAALNVSPGMFDMLQAPAVIGRTLQPDDGRPGAAPVIMLSHDLWQTRFGSDPGVIGRSIRLGPQTRQVVGVAPRGFRFPPQASADVIVPLVTPHEAPAERKSGWTFAAGRLRPGLTIADAAPQLAALSRQLETEHPDQNLGSLYYPRSLRDELVGETRGQLLLLQGAVAFVLLIACVNVANLLLVRMLSRRHEMALRAALGAGRARLAAQLAAEIGVIAVAGAATGVVLAWWGVPLLVELVPGSVDVPGLDNVGINGGVLAFAACAAAGSGLLFTLAAAAAAGRASATALTAPARSGVSRSTRRATSALVMAEVALALVLLIGAGLVLRSFARLMSVDPGFRIQGLVALDIQLPPDRYREADARRSFYRDTLAGLAAAPGVAGAGAAIVTPLTGNNWTVSFERSDRPVPAGQRPPDVGWQSVSAGFFETMGIPLRAGRPFDARDGGADSAPAVIISEALERSFFPAESAVGRRVRMGRGDAEIVGVVGDIRRAGLRDEPRADMYFPFDRMPATATTLFVRTTGDPAAAVPDLQRMLRAVEPSIVVARARTMEAIAAESAASSRLVLWLLGIFAALALALAAVGVYAVMAYAVRQRSREIGTRMALGATRAGIAWMVMRDGGIIVGGGLALGLAVGLAGARALGSLLFDVSFADPSSLGGAAALLALAMALACYVPARRAAKVDPARTLAE